MEKDVTYLQVQTAKTQVILRNWPENFTVEDRKLTVEKMVRAAGLSIQNCTVSTPTWQEADLSVKVAPITVVQFRSFEDRKWAQEKMGKFIDSWKWEKKQVALTEEEKTQWLADHQPTAAPDGTPQAPQPPPDTKTVWEATLVAQNALKMAPAITQYERRLEAPLNAMMNAYTAAYSAYKKVTFTPNWKTLTVQDDTGAWLGHKVHKGGKVYNYVHSLYSRLGMSDFTSRRNF